MTAYNKRTNALLWQINLRSGATPSLWTYQGVDYLVVSNMVEGNPRVYVIRRDNGEIVRVSEKLDHHPLAYIRMSGRVHNNVYYVGISSNETPVAADPTYPCCSFRGSVHALDLTDATLSSVWPQPFYTMPENTGFAGGAVWGSSFPIDVESNTLYGANGNGYSAPQEYYDCIDFRVSSQNITKAQAGISCLTDNYPQVYIERVFALDLDTGALKTVSTGNSWDFWTLGCIYSPNHPNCPPTNGPDHDFGQAPVLDKLVVCDCGAEQSGNRNNNNYVTGICLDTQATHNTGHNVWVKTQCRRPRPGNNRSSEYQKVLYIGQKSGEIHCFNATDLSLVWKTQSSPGGNYGGSLFGISVDDTYVYSGAVNYNHMPWVLKNSTITYGGGWLALDKHDGKHKWTTANPASYDPSGNVGVVGSNGRSTTSYAPGPPTAIKNGVLVTSADSIFTPYWSPLVFQLNGVDKPIYGAGGWVYLLDKETGNIISSYETKASVYGGFSVDRRCAYVGSGYRSLFVLSEGYGVYKWCPED